MANSPTKTRTPILIGISVPRPSGQSRCAERASHGERQDRMSCLIRGPIPLREGVDYAWLDVVLSIRMMPRGDHLYPSHSQTRTMEVGYDRYR